MWHRQQQEARRAQQQARATPPDTNRPAWAPPPEHRAKPLLKDWLHDWVTQQAAGGRTTAQEET
eukprot:5960030-Lingulodinium_polyedra.AAC.1